MILILLLSIALLVLVIRGSEKARYVAVVALVALIVAGVAMSCGG